MYTCKKRGRKFTIVLGATSFIAGAALQAAAVNLAMLFVGRVLLGVGCGFVTQAGPLYLTEMAPAHLRGGLNFMFQVSAAEYSSCKPAVALSRLFSWCSIS